MIVGMSGVRCHFGGVYPCNSLGGAVLCFVESCIHYEMGWDLVACS